MNFQQSKVLLPIRINVYREKGSVTTFDPVKVSTVTISFSEKHKNVMKFLLFFWYQTVTINGALVLKAFKALQWLRLRDR